MIEFAVGVAVGIAIIAIGWVVFERPEAARSAADWVKGKLSRS